LEQQLRSRDGHVASTQDVIKNLEVSHVGGLTDLRGRVVRCDTSIARLATDVSTASETIKVISRQQQEENARTVDRLHSLDTRVGYQELLLIVSIFDIGAFVIFNTVIQMNLHDNTSNTLIDYKKKLKMLMHNIY